MELVLDTTPLIYLTKSGFYKYLPELEVKLRTTVEVVKELRLEDGGYPENQIVSKLIEDKILVVSDLKKTPKTPNGVHKGEASVITLAKEKRAVAVIDDRIGKLYGEGLGVKTVHTTFPVFIALKKGLISKEKAKDFIDSMIDAGWRCDVETYKNIHGAIEGRDRKR
jgi:predicted nucleic acid-binding protein